MSTELLDQNAKVEESASYIKKKKFISVLIQKVRVGSER